MGVPRRGCSSGKRHSAFWRRSTACSRHTSSPAYASGSSLCRGGDASCAGPLPSDGRRGPSRSNRNAERFLLLKAKHTLSPGASDDTDRRPRLGSAFTITRGALYRWPNDWTRLFPPSSWVRSHMLACGRQIGVPPVAAGSVGLPAPPVRVTPNGQRHAQSRANVLLLRGCPSPFSPFGPWTPNKSRNGHAIAAYVRPAILRPGMAESTAFSPGSACGRREPTGRLVQWLVDLV